MKDTMAFQIVVLYRDFLAYTTKELKALGLNFGQMPLVLYAGKHPGCTQADLTRALALDWGYSQRSIVRLTETGFLTRAVDPGSGCNCLRLTEKGEEAFAVCHQVFGSWDQDKTAVLSEKETAGCLSTLKKLSQGQKGGAA